jgi:hypothetical protein
MKFSSVKSVCFIWMLLCFAALLFGEPEEKTALSLGDFDQGKLSVEPLSAEWQTADDSPNQGNSKANPSFIDGAQGSKKALELTYELGEKYQYRYAALKLAFKKAQDFSKYKSLSFWIKGSGNKLKLSIATGNVKDYDYYSYTISSTPTSDWVAYKIPFTSFFQEGWGEKKDFDLKNVTFLNLQASSMTLGEKGWFAIDDVRILAEEAVDPAKNKNLPDVLALTKFDKKSFKVETEASGVWKTSTDNQNGGSSEAKISFGEGYAKGGDSLRMDYDLRTGYKYPYVMTVLQFDSKVDLMQYEGISFWMRGSGNKFRMSFATADVADYDFHGSELEVTKEWKEYKIPLSFLMQEGWGKPVVFNLENVTAIQFQSESKKVGEKGWIEIDQMVLNKSKTSLINKPAESKASLKKRKK